jgi:hypothetical protein
MEDIVGPRAGLDAVDKREIPCTCRELNRGCPILSLVTILAELYPSSMAKEICKVSIWGCIQKFPDWVDEEIYAYKNKHSLRSNTEGYGGKTR